MSTMILAFFFMLIIVCAMAVSIIFGGKPIAGSCGGMKALGLDLECEICGGNPALCDAEDTASPSADKQVPSELTTRVGR